MTDKNPLTLLLVSVWLIKIFWLYYGFRCDWQKSSDFTMGFGVIDKFLWLYYGFRCDCQKSSDFTFGFDVTDKNFLTLLWVSMWLIKIFGLSMGFDLTDKNPGILLLVPIWLTKILGFYKQSVLTTSDIFLISQSFPSLISFQTFIPSHFLSQPSVLSIAHFFLDTQSFSSLISFLKCILLISYPYNIWARFSRPNVW